MTRIVRLIPALAVLFVAACGGDPASVAASGETPRETGPGAQQTAVAQLLDCAREEGITLISAHRGGAGPGLPENSLAAIRHAAERGAAFAEIDLSRSADGAIVLMHDDTLDRTTTGSGRVSSMYLNDLRRFQLRDPQGNATDEPIPTLDEAFAVALDAGIFLQLDLKNIAPDTAARVASDVGQAGRTLIIAYSADTARQARRAVPGIGLSLGADAPRDLEAAEISTDGLFAWLGGGVPSARLDADFASLDIETGAHAFREEEDGVADYTLWRDAGVEVLAVDDVITATQALGMARDHCPAAFE